MNNMMQIIQMLRAGGDPQQLVLGFLQNQLPDSPMTRNIINLAKNNRTAEIEQIARNLAKQKGIDFDKEFKAFKQQFGL